MHERTIICKQLFAGQKVGSPPMKRREKMYQTIIHVCSLIGDKISYCTVPENIYTGLEIATNTVANATNFFSLATKNFV